MQYKTGMYFSFNFGWHSIQLDIVCWEQGCVRGFLLNVENPKRSKIYFSMIS